MYYAILLYIRFYRFFASPGIVIVDRVEANENVYKKNRLFESYAFTVYKLPRIHHQSLTVSHYGAFLCHNVRL